MPTPHRSRIAALFVVLTATVSLTTGALAATNRLIDFVDPLIGTSGGGNTYPGAVAPFGMAQFTPSTRGLAAGYEYNTPKIEGFALTQMSGVGCDNYGDVFLTPTTGPVMPTDFGSAFSHKNESAAPGFYRVTLDRYHVGVDLTATEHAGVARFTFPAGQLANLLIPISHTQTSSKAAKIKIEPDGTIDGQVSSGGFCGSNEVHTVYFVIRPEVTASASGVFRNGKIVVGARSATQSDDKTSIGAYLTFPSTARTVEVKVGISFVDLDGARRNLASEIGRRSFDDVRKQTAAAWEQELHRIEVTPQGGRKDLKVFYTALYHCLLMPNVFSDVDGRYVGFDGAIYTARHGHSVYANFSGWDIYRSDVTLLGLIEPRRLEDMCDSIALMARQLGHIDRWPTANHPTTVMNGDPLSSMAATAWSMGLRDFDMPAVYAAMTRKQTATDQFDQIGYIPGDVSTSQEYAYAFAAVADVAKSLGKTADVTLFTKRALAYRNLFNAQSGFLQPRDESGSWPPFSGTQGDGFTEGSGWQYIWLEPQDVAGLIACLGGELAFNAKLDSFFAHPPKRWDARYYNPENEVDLEAPFLYNWSGQPWKTQAVVRELLGSVYDTSPKGIPGNDDCGEMSSWYILASLGLYPTDPARPALEIVSPTVKRAVIHLSGPSKAQEATITTTGDGAYIQSVSIGGMPWSRNWLAVDALTSGKSIVVNLGREPNKQWGVAKSSRPPSISDSKPLTLSPLINSSGFVGDDISITDADPDATVYYTLDGSEPTPKSTRFISLFPMNHCGIVQARAFSPGRLPSLTASTMVTMPLPSSSGTGLSATYYSKPDFTGATVTRVDPTIDFGWADGKPDKSIGPENFSARWVGEIKAPYTADFTISTISDDAVRVWVDGKLIIEDWKDHSPKTDSATVHLEGGRMYPIKIDYFNHGDGSACRLMWSGPCLSTQVIPAGWLYPSH